MFCSWIGRKQVVYVMGAHGKVRRGGGGGGSRGRGRGGVTFQDDLVAQRLSAASCRVVLRPSRNSSSYLSTITPPPPLPAAPNQHGLTFREVLTQRQSPGIRQAPYVPVIQLRVIDMQFHCDSTPDGLSRWKASLSHSRIPKPCNRQEIIRIPAAYSSRSSQLEMLLSQSSRTIVVISTEQPATRDFACLADACFHPFTVLTVS